MMMRMRISFKLNTKKQIKFLSVLQVAEQALANGPKAFRPLAKIGRKCVITFLLLTQFGFCCAYSIFVADTLTAVISNLTERHVQLTVLQVMVIELPFMILYCFIRDLKTLSIFSTLANVLQSIGIVLIFSNLLTDLPPSWDRPTFASWSTLPLYFGTVVYAFEGIGIVLPLQKEMKEPSAFAGFCGVLNTGMVLVGSLYLGKNGKDRL